MKRRSFFKGFLGLIGVGASGFLLKESNTSYVNYVRETDLIKGTTKEGWIKVLQNQHRIEMENSIFLQRGFIG